MSAASARWGEPPESKGTCPCIRRTKRCGSRDAASTVGVWPTPWRSSCSRWYALVVSAASGSPLSAVSSIRHWHRADRLPRLHRACPSTALDERVVAGTMSDVLVGVKISVLMLPVEAITATSSRGASLSGTRAGRPRPDGAACRDGFAGTLGRVQAGPVHGGEPQARVGLGETVGSGLLNQLVARMRRRGESRPLLRASDQKPSSRGHDHHCPRRSRGRVWSSIGRVGAAGEQ